MEKKRNKQFVDGGKKNEIYLDRIILSAIYIILRIYLGVNLVII